jgi:hypothetical protein
MQLARGNAVDCSGLFKAYPAITGGDRKGQEEMGLADAFTGSEHGALSAGRSERVIEHRIRVAGDDAANGIYFVPAAT